MPAPQGIALVEELLAADYANASLRAQALQILALFQAMRGEFELSRRAAADAWDLIEEFDLRLLKGIYAGDVGFAELIARDLDRAEFVLRRGHDLLVEIGDVGVRSTVDGLLSDVLFLRGRDDEALELADGSRAIAAIDDLDSQPRSRAARARVLASRGALDEALDLLHEAVALVEPIDFTELKGYVHEVLGEVLARAGRTDDAAAAVQRAIALLRAERERRLGRAVARGRRGSFAHRDPRRLRRGGVPELRAREPGRGALLQSRAAPLAAAEPTREQRKVVTVLFCDLVGSTALGESTDPEALRARMRRYFEDLRVILERHGGTVEKFVGDAVMAVFGIPVSHEDDALRAVRAAAEMRAQISEHGLEARIGDQHGRGRRRRRGRDARHR